ncbi:sialate O-acetylesterase [Spirosoma terrae]|uniref:DUF11 domain-containing protein n=1 Tax=Spirosoma terrae TaxID=1968276 RepID=A0A6L9L8Q2_9BACT|nr:sialate O-acetylesterase [Spirosoma terrae]NDU96936.1 DUF11 domain-containing protein [Spirosoma terrae]
MSSCIRTFAILFLLWWPVLGFSQLTVTSPVPRIVYQRNQLDVANIVVTGQAPSNATSVEARFVPMAVGQGEITAWLSLSFLPSSTTYRGTITVKKGYYRLDVRAKTGSTILAETKVNRVGVGEVFIIAGQSNAYGGFERVPNSQEDRVSCLDFRQTMIDEYLLPFRFSNVSYGSNIGPSQPPHLWGVLGDRLVRRLNAPVMFLGAALGGTSSAEWQQSAAGNLGNTLNSSVYRRLGLTLMHYASRTGVRAVLWHQGESDLSTSTETYFNNIQYVINKSRQQTGFNQLAWMVSRASYILGNTSPPVIAAQNQLIAQVPNVFAGPATDSIVGSANRPDNIHLYGEGLYRFINTWEQCLNTAFFANSVPFSPNNEATLITSGYTLPLTRRPGETIQVASLRSDAHENDNQYVAQILRADNNQLVYESPATNSNPIMVTLPANLPDGQYRMRTRSTHPITLGTLGEAFQVQQSAASTGPQSATLLTVQGGTDDPVIQRFGYRYEAGSHGFFSMVRATAPVEIRIQRIDGGSFSDSGWNLAGPKEQFPDYLEFADFNYIRNYPPAAFGVGGVAPGRYRFSVRRQGDSGTGLWFDVTPIDGRNILYYAMEPIGTVAPILTADGLPTPCVTGTFPVYINISEGAVNNGNTFTIQLSDPAGSFTSPTTIGSGNNSPVMATIPANLLASNTYRIRAIGSNPAVVGMPSSPLTICSSLADLSMGMQVDNRVPTLNQIVSVTLTITNDGPQPATGVRAQSLLPPNVEFVDSPNPGITASGNAVTLNAGSISVGQTIPYTFRMKATQAGTFFTAAQITESQLQDPDSQPNSGTGDGQDDASMVDMRTPDAVGPLVVSPNPNQTPLPPVASSQPPADPTKADLSLDVTASQLTVAANVSLTLTVTVKNRGGLTATNAVVRLLLPGSWQVTNSSGLTISGQLVSATISSIAVDGSATINIPLQAGTGGTAQVQIFSVNQPDSDSTPGNGYTNGEDDEASISVRAR